MWFSSIINKKRLTSPQKKYILAVPYIMNIVDKLKYNVNTEGIQICHLHHSRKIVLTLLAN